MADSGWKIHLFKIEYDLQGKEVDYLRYIFVLSIASVAVVMDIYEGKIANQSIAFFWILGIGYQIGFWGAKGIWYFIQGAAAPLLILFVLFLFRMLGPGDIKLFSVLGGLMGLSAVLKCMLCAFVMGAILSAAVIFTSGNLQHRLRYFADYISLFMKTKKFEPYYNKSGQQIENIHFAVPILLSVMLYIGGYY